MCVCVCVCVCPFVCYHVFCDYAQRGNKTAIPTGSSQKRRFSYNYCVQKLWPENNKPKCKLALAYLHSLFRAYRRGGITESVLHAVACPCQTLSLLLESDQILRLAPTEVLGVADRPNHPHQLVVECARVRGFFGR